MLFIHEPLATRAVALSLTYGADLIIVAYILVVIAAIIFTIRRRMAPVKTVILLIGLAVLGYVVKATFAPFPAPPLQLGRARRRDYPGRRDRPAVRVPAAAARDPRIAPSQSRGQRPARRTGLRN